MVLLVSSFIVLRYSSTERFAEECLVLQENSPNDDSVNVLKTTPALITKHLQANGNPHRSSSQMFWLRLYRITNKSNVTELKRRVKLAVELSTTLLWTHIPQLGPLKLTSLSNLANYRSVCPPDLSTPSS